MTNDEWWDARFRHPGLRGLMRRMERDVAELDFEVCSEEAMRLANDDREGYR